MSTIANLAVKLSMDSSDFERGIGKAESAGKSLSQKLGDIGKTMTAAVTLPILGAGAAAIKMSTDFNKGLANIASLNVATARVNEFKKGIQDLSIETGASTDDLSEGMYQVVSAFGDTADSMKILRINAKGARAGLAKVPEAIALTSAVTKAYGDTSATAVQQATDLGLKTVELGQTTFPELAASIGTVSPLAASLGVEMDDLFAVMATGSGVTGTSSQVSTQFRGILQSLMAPTKDMTELTTKMGYANAEAMLQGEGVLGTIKAIVKTAESSNKPLQSYIGSIEGQTLALALADPLAEKYISNQLAMADAAGKTDAAFLAQTQGVNAAGFAMEQLQRKMDVVMQRIGDGIAPALGIVLDKLSPVIDKALELADAFAKADPDIQTLVVALAGVAAALGPIFLLLPGIISGFKALGGLMAALSGWAGLAVGAIILLGFAWENNWGGIQEKTTAAIEAMRPAFDELLKWIDLAMKGDFSGLWAEVGAALTSVQVAVDNFKWSDYITPLVAWSVYITKIDWGEHITRLMEWSLYIGEIIWKDYITPLVEWSVYIGKIVWSEFITKLNEWATYITAIDWGKYITPLVAWSVYIGKLIWSEHIIPLAVWSVYIGKIVWTDYITKLDWKTIGLTAIDWATWIPAIAWTLFITPLSWTVQLGKFLWSTYISKLTWSNFISTITTWNEWISDVNWSLYLSPLAWGTYISSLLWSNYVFRFAWEKFIEKVRWLDFIPKLQWPSIPSFPGWAAIAGAFGFGGATASAGANPATQTGSGLMKKTPSYPSLGYASGGLAKGLSLVGEQGPELAFFGGAGADILSNPDSLKWLESLGIMGFQEGTTPRPAGLYPPMGPSLFPTGKSPITDIGKDLTAAAKNISSAADTLTESATSMSDATGEFRSALQSVPGLFGTSEVTADQMRMADLGIPQEFADTYLRRLTDEVINGVPWEDVDIQDAAARANIDPNLPGEVILELFRNAWNDSSLFANPANLDLIDQGAVKAAIQKQQDQLAGQFNILQLFGITDEGLQSKITGLGDALATNFQTEMTPEVFEPVGAKMATAIAGGFGNVEAAATAQTKMTGALVTVLTKADMQSKLNSAGSKAAAVYWSGWQDFFKKVTIPTPTPAAGTSPIPTPKGLASGGAVTRGVPYIVGEAGSELFISNRSGQIIPHDIASDWIASGAGVTVNNYGDLNNEIDLQALTFAVAERLQRRR